MLPTPLLRRIRPAVHVAADAMDAADIENADDEVFVDTPYGIFTAAGTWFHTTEEALREYAAPVLEQVSLRMLIEWAEVWVRSPQICTLWLLPILLLAGSLEMAVLGSIALYIGWKLLSPSVVSPLAARALNGLDIVGVQGVYYVFVLSILAAQEQYAAVGVGLVGFVVLRWNLLEWAVRPLLRPLLRRMYALPLADQVLRAFIIRAALQRNISLPQLDAIEREIRQNRRSKRSQS